ncbi:hypothetical protein [Acinetobacter larvae]|uniref:Uncharacterized protein n=1 Tax=Acinetobacter larvae TaxID=1789224 RepID=A0A1B2M2Z3_9GAMM|nr:hypothetical protein [Acinetobacter larvae]AOA59549.1 hypothetical protein BFG52_15150 [Acinetobacter larvae]
MIRHKFKLKYVLFGMLSLCMVWMLLACQKAQTVDHIEHELNTVSEPKVQDLDALCQELDGEIQNLDHQRGSLALEQINQNLRMCLQVYNFEQQMQVMDAINQMYGRFLQVARSPEEQQALEHYAVEQYLYPTIHAEHYALLNARDRYLIRHQGQFYLELYINAKQEVRYRRQPQYLAKLFAIYLPEAEKQFIQQLAQQNERALIKQQSLLLSPQQLAERAQFWQNYLQTYPNSYFKKDAQYLLQVYQALLFKGTTKSAVSYLYQDLADIQPSSLRVIQALAEQPHGALAEKARKFIHFMHMSDAQRAAQIDVAEPLDDSNAQQKVLQQLNQYVGLIDFDIEHPQKDCFSDAICYEI